MTTKYKNRLWAFLLFFLAAGPVACPAQPVSTNRLSAAIIDPKTGFISQVITTLKLEREIAAYADAHSRTSAATLAQEGGFCKATGQSRKALVCYLAAIKLDSALHYAWYQAVCVLCEMGHGQLAISVLSDLARDGFWGYELMRQDGDLGVLYTEGGSVPQDSKEGVKWLRKAAEQNYARAQHNLGCMYYEGRGVPRDYDEAVRWFRRAAYQNLACAQLNLGIMYASGRGVNKDPIQAHAWLTLADVNGDKKGLKAVAQIETGMTSGQKAEARKLARELLEKLKQQ